MLEVGLSLDASVICIVQELFWGNKNLSHVEFNLYWPFGTIDQKDMRVLIAVQKDILSPIIVKHRTNLVSHRS